MYKFLTLLMIVPGLAFAASEDNMPLPKPPKPTETTTTCKGVMVWDTSTGKCVKPKGAALDADTLYDAARELAYGGRYQDAQGVLREIADQNDDRVLTYWGFTHRRMGNLELAQMFYEQAITLNPDNLLARSYMGQGMIEDGRTDAAIAQWREIKARGGTGSWPEVSLRDAIRTGTTYSY